MQHESPIQSGIPMKTNVGGTDRALRIGLGILLLAWAVVGGPVWAWLGVVPLATGLFRFCPAYVPFGFSTCKREDKSSLS